jgi:hypothetical protein
VKRVDLIQVPHDVKIGSFCQYQEPNVIDDSIFYADGKAVGFYIKDLKTYSVKLSSLIDLANQELRSDRVPKSEMKRSSGVVSKESQVLQYSTIIGSVPPKPNMRRLYPTISSVHGVKSASNFIKAMLMICKMSEDIIRDILPEQYEAQLAALAGIDDKWRFGKLFTSSISNYNIPAAFHIDRANIKNTVNVIITKRKNAKGGCLNVPDYNITVEQADNSMLVYPAWANMHGVTPIEATYDNGYRNSLIFYPLKAFVGLK